MNKKILVVSILAVFTLVAISFASAVSSNTVKSIEKKESPLYRIRTRRAIREKIGDLVRRFFGERIFFLPFEWLKYSRQGENQWTQVFPPTCLASAHSCFCKCGIIN